MTEPCIRILLAKIGLDGHDRGVKLLARCFSDAASEEIYTGLWQTSESTMHAAAQEDVDIVGVSLLSAAHMTNPAQQVPISRVGANSESCVIARTQSRIAAANV